jgi:hypothetical protein
VYRKFAKLKHGVKQEVPAGLQQVFCNHQINEKAGRGNLPFVYQIKSRAVATLRYLGTLKAGHWTLHKALNRLQDFIRTLNQYDLKIIPELQQSFPPRKPRQVGERPFQPLPSHVCHVRQILQPLNRRSRLLLSTGR